MFIQVKRKPRETSENNVVKRRGAMVEKTNPDHLPGKIAELEELLQAGKILNTLFDFQKAVEAVVDQAMRIVEAEAGTFWFLDEEQNILLPLVARGPRAEALEGLHLQRGEGIAGQVIERGEPVLIEDVARDSLWARRFDLTTGFVTRSMLVLPFSAKGRVFGSLQLINKQNNNVFSAEDLRKCQALVEQAALIIWNNQLYSTQEKFLFSLIKTIVSFIEARSPQNKGHAERVCRYATLIAGELEVSAEEQKALAITSLLHDLGKLTEDELEKHPTAGAQIIYQLEPRSFARQIWLGVLYHHEKYDGSGFPVGLKGKDIPLIARIIGLANFFDHLTRSMEFKSLLAAVDELKHYSGNYLDPYLVEIFTDAIKKSQIEN